MKENTRDRAIRLGEYIVDTKNTVRKTAAAFGISKSTVHTDVTKRNCRTDQQ
ncbi:MAG: sporulation transcriptional regulator SpoIIID [Clostridia bacterium]|nr:sporulation transcriptional regulator SpoIIID [Clostridia bacterium]